jgi:hypothetical protein
MLRIENYTSVSYSTVSTHMICRLATRVWNLRFSTDHNTLESYSTHIFVELQQNLSKSMQRLWQIQKAVRKRRCATEIPKNICQALLGIQQHHCTQKTATQLFT